MTGYYRLFLSVIVVIVHSANNYLLPSHWGISSVMAFFLISGYVIPLSYHAHYNKIGQPKIKGVLRFYLNRVLRIYPLYFLGFMMFPLYVWLTGNETIMSRYIDNPMYWLRNLALIGSSPMRNSFGFWKDTAIPFSNAPAWSLDIEMCFYLLIPLLGFCVMRNKLYYGLAFFLIMVSPLFWDLAGPYGNYFGAGYLLWLVLRDEYGAERLYEFIRENQTILVIFALFIGFRQYGVPFILPSAAILILLRDRMNKSTLSGNKVAGDLSYPVYVFHFFFCDPFVARAGFSKESSILYMVSMEFLFIIGMFFIGYLSLVFVCYPIDKLRAKVRVN